LRRRAAQQEAPPPPPPVNPDEIPPDFVGQGIISPSNLTADAAPRAKKVVRPDDPGQIVRQEMMFILPPGEERLTKVPVNTDMLSKTGKMLAATLRQSGVGFVYMSVFAPSAGRLEGFQKKHPVVSKLLTSETGTGVIPSAKGRGRTNGKEKTHELLLTQPADKEFKSEIVHLPPDANLANAMAVHKYPIAYIRCSAPNAKVLETIKSFLQDAQYGRADKAS